jgi:Tol biopolymer transport system component
VEPLEVRRLLAAEAISLAAPEFYGDSGNGGSNSLVTVVAPSVSADGQLIVFDSFATNLTPNDMNGHTRDVFLRDLSRGVTTLVSVNQAGTGSGNRPSMEPQLSANGRFVAFESDATDLVSNDLNNTRDVFVRDLLNGFTHVVSINGTATGTADSFSELAGISADGRYVLFRSWARNLILGVPDNKTDEDLFVRDIVAGVTQLVSVNLAGQHAGVAPGAAISDDGRFVAFVSAAGNLAAGVSDTNGVNDVFVRDLQAGTTRLASVNHDGTAAGSGESGRAAPSPRSGLAVSSDGRYVAFNSSATNLVANFIDLNGSGSDVYLRDLQAATTTLISINTEGTGGGNGALPFSDISMTPDGRHVAFTSEATNLVAGPGYYLFVNNVFVRDVTAGVTRLASINTAGTFAAAGAAQPALSADGRRVAFTSSDGNLIAGDINGRKDVFVRDLLASQTYLASGAVTGDASGDNHSSLYDWPTISPDGTRVAFTSFAGNLVAHDNNRDADVFAYDIGAAVQLVSRRTADLPTAFTGVAGSTPISISPDGRFVMFTSTAGNLVDNDFNRVVADLFVRDRLAKTTSLVSVNAAGTASGNGDSGLDGKAVITPDGRYVAFASRAGDLVPGLTTDGYEELYLRDRETGTTSLVSLVAAGNSGSQRGVLSPQVSADGRYVAFVSPATNLVDNFVSGNPSSSRGQLYFRDMATGTTTLASHLPGAATVGLNADVESVAMSADGRYLVFSSTASNVAPDDTNNTLDVFAFDRLDGTTRLVSVSHTGAGAGNNRSFNFSISADGRFVAFHSDATDLVTLADTNNFTDVFVRDLVANVTVPVTLNAAGTGFAELGGRDPLLSADGTAVAFQSYSSDLVASDANNASDVFVRDLASGTTRLASVNATGTGSGNSFSAPSGGYAISRDGRHVAFLSQASDLTSGFVDRNESWNDLYVRDMAEGITVLASENILGDGGADGQVDYPFVSDSGGVVFQSQASNLYAGDRNALPDVFAANFAQELPSVDLAVEGITVAPGTVTPGRDIQVTWTVHNQAATDANTDYWLDAVYIAPAPTLSPSAQLLTVVPRFGGLAANGSYTVNQTLTVPGLLAGDYYLIVKTGRSFAHRDTDATNNVAASAAFAITIPQLVLNAPWADTFTGPGQSRYYRLDLPAGMRLRLQLDSAATGLRAELFLQRDRLPAPGIFTAQADIISSGTSQLHFRVPEAGTYYVRVSAARIPPSESVPVAFSIEAAAMGFSVASTDLKFADRGGSATIRIRGSFLSMALSADLVSATGTRYAASRVHMVDEMDVYATFDLTQVPVGVYRLEVSQSYSSLDLDLNAADPLTPFPEQLVAALDDAFTVLEAQPDNTDLMWSAPAFRRGLQSMTYYLTFTNRGTHDVPAPVFEISTDDDVAYLTSPLARNLPQQGSLQVIALGTQGPAGIVRPGDTVMLRIDSQSPPPVRLLESHVWQVPADETAVDFTFVLAALGLDPSTEAGSVVLGALTNRYGATWSSLQAGLRDEATRLSLAGRRIDTVLGLLIETASNALADYHEQLFDQSNSDPSLPPKSPPQDDPPVKSDTTLALLELALFGLANAMPAFGGVRGGEHLRHFLGAPGADGNVPRDPIHYDDDSDIAAKVRAYTNAAVSFEKVDKQVKETVKKRLEAEARSERYDTYPYFEPSVQRLDFYIYVPIALIDFNWRPIFVGGPPEAFELQVSFGGTQKAEAFVNDIKFSPVQETCGVRTVHYKAKIDYEWTDEYAFDFKDRQSDAQANAAAGILQDAGWARKFNTSFALNEEIEGVVTLDSVPARCFPSPRRGPLATGRTRVLTSEDPNAIVGPAGVGDAQFVRPQDALPYTIFFENDPQKATAPAQEVFITHTLDQDLDWNTFQLGPVGFGSLHLDVPRGLQSYATRVNYINQDGSPLLVDVNGAFDIQTGEVKWTFRSLDPLSGALPDDVFAGFLPVNDVSHRGEGYVSFLVNSLPGLPTGQLLEAQADIVFDTNAPLATNVFSNTIDSSAPASLVAALPAVVDRTHFTVNWAGDDGAGVGIATYDVYVSEDGGPFTPFILGTANTSSPFHGQDGVTYGFFSVATDHLGYRQPVPGLAQATTRVVAAYDYGDAPNSATDPTRNYPSLRAENGARHVISDLFLGTRFDTDDDGQPDSLAQGDDTDGQGNDDDGVITLASRVTSASENTISSFVVTASAPGKLDAWIDFNQDGDWSDPFEQILIARDVEAGPNLLSFTVPAGATAGDTFARFRLTSQGGMLPGGAADDGEVEDYRYALLNGDVSTEVVITLWDGQTDLVADATQLVARRGTATVFGSPANTISQFVLAGTSGNNTLGLGVLGEVGATPIPFRFDGGVGVDGLRLLARDQEFNLAAVQTNRLTNVEFVDIAGTGPNRLTLSAQSVRDATDAAHILLLRHDNDDTVMYGPGWRSVGPQLIAGEYLHLFRQGDTELRISNLRAWQNPVGPLDSTQDTFITPRDALVIINTLNALGRRELTTPTSQNDLPEHYFDVNGDHFVSPLDALLVINYLTGLSGSGEGEAAAMPLELNVAATVLPTLVHPDTGRSIWQRDAGDRRAIRFEDATHKPRTITDDLWDTLRQRPNASDDGPTMTPRDSRHAFVTLSEYFAQWEAEPQFNELEQTIDELLSADQHGESRWSQRGIRRS